MLLSTSQIVSFVTYYCYGVKSDRILDSIEELKHFHGIEIRSHDSFIIPLMIKENRAMHVFHCFIMSSS